MARLNLEKRILDLAVKYYGTTKLRDLSPQQLNKITNWATNTNPETHKHIKGRKYSGNTYNKLKGIY